MSIEDPELVIEPGIGRVILSRSLLVAMVVTIVSLSRPLQENYASGEWNFAEVASTGIALFAAATVFGGIVSLVQYGSIRRHLTIVCTPSSLTGPSPKWSWTERVTLSSPDDEEMAWKRDWWDHFCTRSRVIDRQGHSIAVMDFVYQPEDLMRLKAWCAKSNRQQAAA